MQFYGGNNPPNPGYPLQDRSFDNPLQGVPSQNQQVINARWGGIDEIKERAKTMQQPQHDVRTVIGAVTNSDIEQMKVHAGMLAFRCDNITMPSGLRAGDLTGVEPTVFTHLCKMTRDQTDDLMFIGVNKNTIHTNDDHLSSNQITLVANGPVQLYNRSETHIMAGDPLIWDFPAQAAIDNTLVVPIVKVANRRSLYTILEQVATDHRLWQKADSMPNVQGFENHIPTQCGMMAACMALLKSMDRFIGYATHNSAAGAPVNVYITKMRIA